MDEEKRFTCSKTFEIAFIASLIFIGILIALAIWSTGRNVDVNENDFNRFTNQVTENQKEIITEITALRTEMNNKFSNVYTNQDNINKNVNTFGNEIINRIDRLSQRVTSLSTPPTRSGTAESQ